MTNEILPPIPRKSKSEIYWELVEALKWYVAEDEINEGDPENEYWVAGKKRAQDLLKMVEREHTEPQYVIYKSTRLPGKESYSGPTWDDIGLRYAYATTYTDLAYAEELAILLSKANHVGFLVAEMSRDEVIDIDG
jgi:hypothetical protein